MLQSSVDPRAADAPIDAKFVTWRLEEAGAALLALPQTGWSTRLRTSNLDVVRAAVDSYDWGEKPVRPPVPSASAITRMDEAMDWIQFIPLDRYVLRRIVGARSLVNPLTDRHLFPWRRLAAALGADHKAVQRWHAEGIALIVAALNGVRPSPRPSPNGRGSAVGSVRDYNARSPACGTGWGEGEKPLRTEGGPAGRLAPSGRPASRRPAA